MLANVARSPFSNKTKFLSLCLIAILALSPSIVSVNNFEINYDDKKQTGFGNDVSTKINTHKTTTFQVSLTENIGLAENYHVEQFSTTHPHSTSLQEKIVLLENKDIIKNIARINQNFDPITMIDKISNNDRVRFTGKINLIDNIFSNIQNRITLNQLEGNFIQHMENNIVQPMENRLHVDLISNILPSYNVINIISQSIQSTEYNIEAIEHIIIDPKNSTIFLILFPLPGYFLLGFREEKFQFFKPKQVLSCCHIGDCFDSIAL